MGNFLKRCHIFDFALGNVFKTISLNSSGSLKFIVLYPEGFRPRVLVPVNIFKCQPSCSRNANCRLFWLRSCRSVFVWPAFLYCGWLAPRRTFLLFWAPCILHALVPKAAGLLQGSRVLFDLHPHNLAPCILTLGKGIWQVSALYLGGL